MGEAEHALWRAAGLRIAPPGAEVLFPCVAAACDFRSPLRFEDEFDVRIRIAAIGKTSLRYACRMTRDNDLLATGSMTTVSVSRRANQSMTAVPLPPEIAMRFEVAADPDAA